MKKIVLTGGGTAGHVTPNLALIPALQKKDYEIVYIGSEQGMEKELIEKVKILAEEQDRSFSQYINLIVKEHINAREQNN